MSVGEGEFVYRAVGAMSAGGFRHLGVRNAEGVIVGALSARDLLSQRGGDSVLLGDSIDAAATPAEAAATTATTTQP